LNPRWQFCWTLKATALKPTTPRSIAKSKARRQAQRSSWLNTVKD